MYVQTYIKPTIPNTFTLLEIEIKKSLKILNKISKNHKDFKKFMFHNASESRGFSLSVMDKGGQWIVNPCV